jgi:ubiquinone/menaquinone biosynthesis C-methylase UbiE
MGSQVGELAAHFARRAAGYATNNSWVNDTETLMPILGLLQQKPGGVSFDIGAGTGAIASAREPSSPDAGRLIGVDISHSMLLQHSRYSPAVVGDAHRLPFMSGCADFVICRQSIHYLDFPEMVLAEIGRVLAPDGKLLIAQIVPFEDPDDQAWWKTAVTLRQPLRRHRWTSTELQESLRQAGFVLESVRNLERRTSMRGWLDRYSLDSEVRRALLDHFQSASPHVRELRGFAASPGEIEYSLRWLFITARPGDAVTAPGSGSVRGAHG